jgi:hypothetical protein
MAQLYDGLAADMSNFMDILARADLTQVSQGLPIYISPFDFTGTFSVTW